MWPGLYTATPPCCSNVMLSCPVSLPGQQHRGVICVHKNRNNNSKGTFRIWNCDGIIIKKEESCPPAGRHISDSFSTLSIPACLPACLAWRGERYLVRNINIEIISPSSTNNVSCFNNSSSSFFLGFSVSSAEMIKDKVMLVAGGYGWWWLRLIYNNILVLEIFSSSQWKVLESWWTRGMSQVSRRLLVRATLLTWKVVIGYN